MTDYPYSNGGYLDRDAVFNPFVCGIIPADRDRHRSWHYDLERVRDAAYNIESDD